MSNLSIGNLSSMIDQTTSQAQSTSSLNLTSKLNNLSGTDDDELLQACKDFESYFMEMVMKEMEKSTKVFSDEEEDSYTGQITSYFKDSVYETLADEIVEQSGGSLAQSLYEQMKRNYGLE